MKITILLSWILCLLLSSGLPNAYAKSLLQQRWQFKSAYQALSSKDLKSFERLSAQLSDYPIVHYLRYFYLRSHLKSENAQTIQAFLDQYQDSSMVPPLRRAWLQQLAKERDWVTFIAAYAPQKNTLLRCNYLTAHLYTREKLNNDLVDEAKNLWLVGKSQPKACDPAFDYLYAHDLITHHNRWQRIHLSMENGKYGLARFIAKGLPKSDKKLVKLWQSMHKKPTSTLKKFKYPDTAIAREIVLHGIKRLARKNVDQAYAYWEEYKKRYTFNRSEKGEILRYIALKGVSQNHPDATHWLEKIDDEWLNDQVNQARLKMALIAEDWKRVIKLSQNLVIKDEKNQHQWQYWWARALEQIEQTDEAEKRFRALSQHRDYYGFSAANRINKSYSFQQQPLNVSKRFIAKLKKNAGLIRARELYFVGWPAFARSEWHKALSTLNIDELKAAVVIAHEMGWHDRAIFAAHKAKAYNDLKIRFPLPFYDMVSTHAEAQQLDFAYVYAVMRQESAFQMDARSSAGALGLMQLISVTAREVARKQKIQLKSTHDILVPNTNIQLGTAYLRQMLNRFDDNHLLATAAYNAGPTRAKRWSKKYGCFPPDIWIELIPFTQTRDYVKRVLSYAPVFEFQIVGHTRVKPMLLDTILADECTY